MDTNILVPLILMVISIAALAFVVAYAVSKKATANKRATEERLKELSGDEDSIALVKSESITQKKKKKRTVKSRQSGFFDRFGDTLYKELQAAEIEMRPEEYLTIWLLVAILPASVVALFIGKVAIEMALLVAGIALPFVVIKSKQKKRVKAFEDQLGDALLVCCNCLRSGLSFQQAMETIADDTPAPLGTEFGRCIAEMNLGSSLDDVLEGMNERIKSDDLKLMVSAVSVQRQTGGNLSEILVTISEKIKDRAQMRQEIKSITAQGRMSGMMVGSMPVILFGAFCLMNYDYVRPFFEETRGNIALGVAIGLEVLAFLVIKKIITIKM